MEFEDDYKKGPGVTIVSAFITGINYREDRNYDRYFSLAKQLLKIPINKIIFLDKSLMSYFKEYVNEYNTLVSFDKRENYLYDYIDKIGRAHV